MTDNVFLRRKAAGEYLRQKFGFCSPSALAKLAVVGGGPKMHYVGDLPLYAPEELDEWARSQVSAPIHSTSERPGARAPADPCGVAATRPPFATAHATPDRPPSKTEEDKHASHRK